MTEVIASDMIMLDSRRDSMGGAPQYDEQDAGYAEPEPELEAPARSFAPQGAPRAQQPSRPAGNGNGGPARPMQQRPAAPAPAPRRPAAPTPADEDDLPF